MNIKVLSQINKLLEHKIVIIFLPINFNMCFGCSKEPFHGDGSFEYPQHVSVITIYSFISSPEPKAHW